MQGRLGSVGRFRVLYEALTDFASLSMCCLISFIAAEHKRLVHMLERCIFTMRWDGMGAFASKLRKQELNSIEMGSELPSCCWDATQLFLFRGAEPQEEKQSLLIALSLIDMNALSAHIYLYRYLCYTTQLESCWS